MKYPTCLPIHLFLFAGSVALLAARGSGAPGQAAKPAAAAMAFTPAELDLAPGETYPVTLFVPSPSGKAHVGVLRLVPGQGLAVQPDRRWTGRVPPWGVKLFPKISAAANAPASARVTATLTPGGTATLNVTVKRPELRLIPGANRLRIQVTNPFRGRPLKGRVSVSNPDRFLGDITARLLDVAPGATGEVEFPLPGAAPAQGETYAFTVTVQTWAGYREQKTHRLAFPPLR